AHAMTFLLSRPRPSPRSTLFPYTTLFRSGARWRKAGGARSVGATDSFVCEWDRENSHDQGLPFPSAGAGKRVYGGDPRADESDQGGGDGFHSRHHSDK